MVTNAPKNTGGCHFRLCFGRKLRAPLAVLLIAERVAPAEPGPFDFNDGIPGRRIRRQLRTADAVKKIAGWGRLNPELSELSWRGRTRQRGFERGAAACGQLNGDAEEARRQPEKRRASKSSS